MNIPDDLIYWEGYDHSLTALENLIELQIQMGFLDEARKELRPYITNDKG
jgi:hypothetical protein